LQIVLLFALFAVICAAPAPNPNPNPNYIAAGVPVAYGGISPYAYSYSNVYSPSYSAYSAYPSVYSGEFKFEFGKLQK
jgi:hypothetical protein